MNSHKHARLTPKGRALLVSRVLDEGWSVGAASEAAGISKRTGFKWLARFRSEDQDQAYAQPYTSSAQREAALQPFVHRYNWHRPHSALNRQPPMSRIPAMSNLLELNS